MKGFILQLRRVEEDSERLTQIRRSLQTWWTYSSQHRPVKRYYIWNMTCWPQFIGIWCLHRNFVEKQNYSFVYLFSGQTFSIYSSDTNMSGHGGFSLIKPLLTRRTWFQHHRRDEGCCCKLCTTLDSVISRIKQGDSQPIYEKAPRAISVLLKTSSVSKTLLILTSTFV